MRVSFLISNISGNTVLRTLPFAEILSKKHEISIIGLKDGAVLAESTKKIKVVAHKRKNFFKNINNLVKESEKSDIVCIVNPVADNSIAGAILKLKGKKLVLDISEDLTCSIGENFFNEKFIAVKQRFFNAIRHFADSIVVGTNYLKKKFGGTVIRTPVNLDNFKDPDIKRIKKKFKKKKLIVYGGTVKRFKGNKDLIKAFSIVEKEIPQSALIMAGAILSKSLYSELKTLIHSSGNNIHFTGYIPLNEMPNYVFCADCLVSTYPNNLLRASQVPTRLFTYMASGKIIVATDVGETRQILRNGECGILVKPDEPKALAKGIITALKNKKLAKKKGLAAKKEAQKYSFEFMQKEVEKSFLVAK